MIVARPDPVGWTCLAVAAAVWLGVGMASRPVLVLAVVVATAAGGVEQGSRMIVILAVALSLGTASGTFAATRLTPVHLVDGPLTSSGRAMSDSVRGTFVLQPESAKVGGRWMVWDGPLLAVTLDDGSVEAGQVVEVTGRLAVEAGRIAGRSFQGRILARSVEVLDRAGTPLVEVANGIRHRVSSGLAAWDGHPGAALVSGFLIGDTRRLTDVDYDALRRAGLTHFVAVSGSNVALFLGLWWLLVGPLAASPRRRALLGILGLVVFVVVTRWEPSVLRASVMAGLLLVSRAAGVSLSGWSVLGLSVAGLLIWSAELADSVGFQLSVAATLGVMASVRALPNVRPRFLGSAMSVTLGAQLAVAPLLLYHFGSLPVLSPIANVVAAPLVASATTTGGIGLLLGAGWLTQAAVGLASIVLDIAHLASGWPQVGWAGFGVIVVVGLAARSYRPLRPAVVVVAIGFVVITATAGGRPPGASVVFLDVGQGDAILVFGSGGEVILVDGGPDPPILLAGLRRYDVDRIDLLILSHPHADHLAGFIDVVDRYPVGAFWHPDSPDAGAQFAELERGLIEAGVPMAVPVAGDTARLGDIRIEILGPLRRYDNLNDQSIVVRITVESSTVLLAGDVEKLAQSELGPIRADILKVPHHGSSTSDFAWLTATQASLAVIQVGENSFGHPALEVVDVLIGAGMRVQRTDRDHDVVIPMPFPGSRP